MKKLLLTVIASLALISSSFAQSTNWPEFYDPDYEMQTTVIAYVQLDGEYINTTNYASYEVAPFVGDEVRGHVFMMDETDLGDLYPTAQLVIAHTASNEAVSFKMFDHATNTLYEDFTCNIDIVTGEDHTEIWDGLEPGSGAVVISFTSASTTTITKHIDGYSNINGNAGYYLIGTPMNIAPTAVTGMVATGDDHYDLYAFDQNEDGAEWRNYKYSQFELVPGQGYLYAKNVSVDLQFTGTPYSGDAEFNLNYTNGKSLAGVNVMGNPFDHVVYLADVTRDFYVMNADRDNVTLATNREIGKLDGFVVIAQAAGEKIKLVNTNPGAKSPRFELNVTNGQNVVDRAAVRFGNGRSLPKYTINEESAQVYIPQFGKDYAVVTADEMGELPVNFKAAKNGTYTIGFNTEDVEFGYLHLIDNKTGNNVDLLETPTYTFDASRADYASRFRLVFATGANNSESFGFISDGNIVLEGVNANTTVQVIDALGRILVSDKGVNTVSTDNMTPGVYVLRLVNGENAKTQKIVVK